MLNHKLRENYGTQVELAPSAISLVLLRLTTTMSSVVIYSIVRNIYQVVLVAPEKLTRPSLSRGHHNRLASVMR